MVHLVWNSSFAPLSFRAIQTQSGERGNLSSDCHVPRRNVGVLAMTTAKFVCNLDFVIWIFIYIIPPRLPGSKIESMKLITGEMIWDTADLPKKGKISIIRKNMP